MPESVARKFLYGTGVRQRGPTSWYAQFRSRRPEQGLRGAVVAGRFLRSVREGDVARVAMKALYDRGLRPPGLTELCVALAEDDLGARVRIFAWKDAVAICEEGIRASSGGPPPYEPCSA